MTEQVTWGLFKGFNPRPTEARWEPPTCPRCGIASLPRMRLLPWVDWFSYGAIGYCTGCARFYHVSSKWEQIPGTHLREDRERLVGHEYADVDFDRLRFQEIQQLWRWHDELPPTRSTLEEINSLRIKYQTDTQEGVLLASIFWTLIWNLEVSADFLLEEFFDFSLAHPQYPDYMKYKKKSVWLGHQVNLAEALERRYPQELSRALCATWSKHRPSAEAFKAGVGFFIPASRSSLTQYGAEFLQSAELARARPPK